eukprot:1128962-Pelagomonas_calceolata.AAC.4
MLHRRQTVWSSSPCAHYVWLKEAHLAQIDTGLTEAHMAQIDTVAHRGPRLTDSGTQGLILAHT